MKDKIKPFVYKCTLDRVVDGDTCDVNLDLGFSIILAKQRIRLVGIDTPESRTRDLAEKKLGLQAKELLKELTKDGFVVVSMVGFLVCCGILTAIALMQNL
jgi:micrococcal nuclease